MIKKHSYITLKGIAHSIPKFVVVFFEKKHRMLEAIYPSWLGVRGWDLDTRLIVSNTFDFFVDIFHPSQGSKYSSNEPKSTKTSQKPI